MVGIEDVAVDGAGGRALGRRSHGQQEKGEGSPVEHDVTIWMDFFGRGNHTPQRQWSCEDLVEKR